MEAQPLTVREVFEGLKDLLERYPEFGDQVLQVQDGDMAETSIIEVTTANGPWLVTF
jgi:hypothetical protein